jgi:hypothetical protein
MRLACAVLVGCGVLGTQAYADTAVSGKLGTLGPGLDFSVGLSNRVGARFSGHYFGYSDTSIESGIEYDMDLKLRSASALLDWHPFGGGFRMSAGALANANRLKLNAVGFDDYDIGDTTYRGNLSLDGDVRFRSAAPYLGIGWGNALGRRGALSFAADLGVAFHGAPLTNLSAQGTVTNLSTGQEVDAGDQSFLQDLLREEENLRRDLERYQYFPVVSVGLLYRF